ncbi:MAG: hypothetical protein BGO69_07320 [Bacteroidetes bacterium 46-16]|nr:MAG: hypothetical protein BGO69_07320 [Bacteroidetes bacterium 46-16]
MLRWGNMILVLLLLCFAAGLNAQGIKKPDDGKKPAKKDTSSVPYIPVYLGHSDKRGGLISKSDFDMLLKQGISSRDSSGNEFNIVGFTFSYVQRNLYEDSVGRLMIVPDYLSEYCTGDTLTPAVSNNIYAITKQSDTAYFDDILLRRRKDGMGAYGKGMKFILTK